jgi:uncharacterized short protein YbdD (DUF466 family)
MAILRLPKILAPLGNSLCSLCLCGEFYFAEFTTKTQRAQRIAKTIGVRNLIRLWRILQDVSGESAYARYCEHLRCRHPEAPLPTEREFYLTRLEERYARPERCC